MAQVQPRTTRTTKQEYMQSYRKSEAGRAANRRNARDYYQRVRREGWRRDRREGRCISCSGLTKWRVLRLSSIGNGKFMERWLPCCRGC